MSSSSNLQGVHTSNDNAGAALNNQPTPGTPSSSSFWNYGARDFAADILEDSDVDGGRVNGVLA